MSSKSKISIIIIIVYFKSNSKLHGRSRDLDYRGSDFRGNCMLFKIKHSVKRNGGVYVENIIRKVIIEIVHLLLYRLLGDFEFLCWEWTFRP
jgi:hypothetical protein